MSIPISQWMARGNTEFKNEMHVCRMHKKNHGGIWLEYVMDKDKVKYFTNEKAIAKARSLNGEIKMFDFD